MILGPEQTQLLATGPWEMHNLARGGTHTDRYNPVTLEDAAPVYQPHVESQIDTRAHSQI